MTDTQANSSSDKSPPLWRNTGFTLMWASVAASGFGDRILMSAALILLGAMAADSDAGRVSLNAATQFFFFAPYLVLSFGAGWLADKLPRKWILLTCDELRAVVLVVALLSVYGLAGDPVIPSDSRWQVYLILLLIGSLAAIFNPSRNAMIPQIVHQRQLQAANALVIGLGVVASMTGAIAASKILDADEGASIKYGLAIAICFYAGSGLFFAFLKPRDADRKEQTDRSLVQAVRYLRDHRRHLRLIAVFTVVWGSAMIVYNAGLTFGHTHFNFVGDELFNHYQLIAATIGGGMLLGAGIISIIGTQRESSIVLMISLIGAALSMAAFTFVHYRPVHFFSGLMIGVFGNMCIINVLSMLQVLSPNYIRGRVMGLANLVSTVGTVSINGVIWQLPNADNWMPATVLATAAILLAIGGIGLITVLTSGPLPSRAANVCWRVNRLFVFSWHSLTLHGKHHVPSTGPVVLAANHTTAMDPFLIQAGSNRLVRWLMLTSFRWRIANFMWNAIDPVCIEHNYATGERSNAMKQVRTIVTELKKGDVIGMFPEGHLQYDNRVLKEFEDGAAAVARLSNATIVPCWVDGTVLSKSMFRHALTPTHSSVTYGQPFVPQKGQSVEEITAEIRRRVMKLGEQEAARRDRQ